MNRTTLNEDRRIIALREIERRIDQPISRHGMAGMRQTFASLGSRQNITVLRARALVQARINQLYGYGPGVVSKLERAADLRRQAARVS